MGKRKAHKRKGDKNKGHKQVHTDWRSEPIPTENAMFKNYYKMQLGLPE